MAKVVRIRGGGGEGGGIDARSCKGTGPRDFPQLVVKVTRVVYVSVKEEKVMEEEVVGEDKEETASKNPVRDNEEGVEKARSMCMVHDLNAELFLEEGVYVRW